MEKIENCARNGGSGGVRAYVGKNRACFISTKESEAPTSCD